MRQSGVGALVVAVGAERGEVLKGSGDLRDLGAHELKGITQKRQVFGV